MWDIDVQNDSNAIKKKNPDQPLFHFFSEKFQWIFLDSIFKGSEDVI